MIHGTISIRVESLQVLAAGSDHHYASSPSPGEGMSENKVRSLAEKRFPVFYLHFFPLCPVFSFCSLFLYPLREAGPPFES